MAIAHSGCRILHWRCKDQEPVVEVGGQQGHHEGQALVPQWRENLTTERLFYGRNTASLTEDISSYVQLAWNMSG